MVPTSGDEGLRVRESSYTARSICSRRVSFFGARLGDRLLIKYSWLQPIARGGDILLAGVGGAGTSPGRKSRSGAAALKGQNDS